MLEFYDPVINVRSKYGREAAIKFKFNLRIMGYMTLSDGLGTMARITESIINGSKESKNQEQ